MPLYLLNSSRFAVPFVREDASAMAYPPLAGSRVLSYSTNALQLLVKELVTPLFAIRYNAFRFTKNQAIESMSDRQGVHSRVMLQGDLHFSVEQIGNVYQREGCVSMIRSERAHCTALYEEGKAYKTLDIYISPGLISQLESFYPEWKMDWNNASAQMLLAQPCFMTPKVKDIVSQILDCPYDESTSPLYFDLKVREYLYVLLEQELHPHKSRYRFTPYEKEKVHEARVLLLSDLEKPPVTIRALSQKVALNEFRLKEGFRHFYGRGIFETFQEARMDRAKLFLLTTNKPIKEIAVLSGYPRSTNFITAFRKHFGLTPASLRRDP